MMGLVGNYELLQILEGHSKGVTTVKISKNNDFVITGGRDSTIRFWRRSKSSNDNLVYTQSEIREPHDNFISSLGITEN